MAETLKLFGSLALLTLAACRSEDPRNVDPARPTVAPVEGNAPPAGSAAPSSAANPGARSPAPEVTTTNPLTPAAGTSPASKASPALGGGGSGGNTGGGAAPTSTAAVTPGPTPPNAADSAAQAAELSAVLTDEQIAKVVHGLNGAEVEQARVALTRAQAQEVKSFAQMMIDHHGEANQQLDALKTQKTDSALAAKLNEESQTSLRSLQQASGSDFDRAYVTAQIDGHQKALQNLQQRLLPNTKGTALKSYLKNLEPRIENHLGRARSLQASLGSAPPAAGEPAPSANP